MWFLELLGIAVFGIAVITGIANSIIIRIILDELDELKGRK